MRVEVAYRGRIEAFDTDRFTEAQPFSGKSMLADLTLDYADVEKKGLWLTAHCYAANEAYRTDGGEAPRRGARRAGGSSSPPRERPPESRASPWTARRCSRGSSASSWTSPG